MNLRTVVILVLIVFIVIGVVMAFSPPGPQHTTVTLNYQRIQMSNGVCIQRGIGWASAWNGSC